MPYLEIHYKGGMEVNWSDWIQDVSVLPISLEETCLRSEVADNSAIYGILSTLSTLGIRLISVTVRDQPWDCPPRGVS